MNPKIIDNPSKMWWSGDKRVEPYMPKINEALERNGLTGDAKTDCYNRAYEAVYKAIIDATAECACLRADLEKVTAERNELINIFAKHYSESFIDMTLVSELRDAILRIKATEYINRLQGGKK